MSTVSMEVQLERMDSKLEKHMAVTETILRSQERTLEDIKEIVGNHDEKFLTREEATAMEEATLLKSERRMDTKMSDFELKEERKHKTLVAVMITTIMLVIGLIEIWPIIT